MKTINQLCAFMENRQSQLAEILSVLSEKGVDLRALTVAEMSDYGVARLIADDCEKAASALRGVGCVVSINPVFAVTVPDEAGALSRLLTALAADGVDIEYMYSIFGHKDGLAYMVISAKDMEIMQASLDKNGFEAKSSQELGLC